MIQASLFICIVLLLGVVALQGLLLRKRLSVDLSGFDFRFESLGKATEERTRLVLDELARNRQELAVGAKGTRQEVNAQLAALASSNERTMYGLRSVLESELRALREDNTQHLERMRRTMDEQLFGTLEKRLGESFRQVSERLELVHRGLGEMQTLANGVGDLKRVLSNVKTRGTWGEVQLGNLLDQILSPEQYAANVATTGTAERVEFAIRLPGRGNDPADVVWLPLDAKFPREPYERVVEAQERADAAAAETAGRELEARAKACAREISQKYLSPPRTTDFAVMFLATEGLYAEVVRRPGLVEAIQRESRVVVAGPTTFAALLNSLQMGFDTLKVQKRSSEVWAVLAAVKTEFARYGEVLAKVQKKLSDASETLDVQVARRTKAIERTLRGAQELTAGEADEGDG